MTNEKPQRETEEVRANTKWLNSRSDPVTDSIIRAALQVHRGLGPGLLESAYLECLAIELAAWKIAFRREVPLPLEYRGQPIPVHYRLDLVVEDAVVVEVKSVEKLHLVHRAQLITYLRAGKYSRGLLLNFSGLQLRNGIQRVVNNWYPDIRP